MFYGESRKHDQIFLENYKRKEDLIVNVLGGVISSALILLIFTPFLKQVIKETVSNLNYSKCGAVYYPNSLSGVDIKDGPIFRFESSKKWRSIMIKPLVIQRSKDVLGGTPVF